jgi:FkbM family methyltransferase
MIHFFDVGANVGQTFDDYLMRRPEFDGAEVWCFEPSPRHLPALMAKAAALANRYKIHVCPFGLRGRSDIATFFYKDDPRGDSFERFCRADHDQTNLDPGFELYVATIAAGDFIEKFIPAGDQVILKLDCEGSEYALLAELLQNPGALSKIRDILVEFHSIPAYPGMLGRGQLEQAFRAIGKPLHQWML